MTKYTITSTTGAYLRSSMRECASLGTDDTVVEDTLRAAAEYLGVTGAIEWLDGGDCVLMRDDDEGRVLLVATPVRTDRD